MASAIDNEEQQEVVSISDPAVITQYRMASDIVNNALALATSLAVPGATIASICQRVDEFMLAETAKLFTRQKKRVKGLAFPTCVSVNNCAGHYSPSPNDTTATLREGDVAKIDLGVHANGFPVLAAQTVVVGADAATPVTGRKADVLAAAYTAAEAVLRTLKPGKKASDVTSVVQRVAEQFRCTPLEGVLSHEMSQFTIDGEKVILLKPSHEYHAEDFEFEPYTVFGIDVVLSTGEGKTRETDFRPTVFKRQDAAYGLRMQASKRLLAQVTDKFQSFGFALRNTEDEKMARLGLKELLDHGLLHAYPVLFERDGEFIAQVKFTALVMPSSTLRITNVTAPVVQSEFSVQDDELKALLASSTSAKKNKKKKKAGAAAAAGSSAAAQ